MLICIRCYKMPKAPIGETIQGHRRQGPVRKRRDVGVTGRQHVVARGPVDSSNSFKILPNRAKSSQIELFHEVSQCRGRLQEGLQREALCRPQLKSACVEVLGVTR